MGIILISLVSAQTLDVKLKKDTYKANENITFTVSLLDSQNLPLNEKVNVIFENPNKKDNVESIVSANGQSEISLGDKANYGTWTLTANYGNLKSNKYLFSIEENELLSISMQGDIVLIKNIGNNIFAKKIDIRIGETAYQKDIYLNVGEETSFRLLAPDGLYNIRITAGKTTLIKSDVKLTGNAIGTLDETIANSDNPITGINPEQNTGVEKKSSNFLVYLFISTILGAAILLAVERHYKRKP